MIWVKQCTRLHRISFAILIPPLKAIAKYLEFFIHTQNSGRNWFYFLWTETSEFVPVLLRSERQLLFLTSPSIPQTAVSPGLLSLTSTTQRLTVLSASFTVVNMLLCYFLHQHFQTETCFVWSSSLKCFRRNSIFWKVDAFYEESEYSSPWNSLTTQMSWNSNHLT